METEKQAVIELLNHLKITYEFVLHQAVFTIDEMEKLNLPKAEVVAKNLFLRDDKKQNYYLVSAHEGKRVDLKALREKIASRPLSFASEEDLNTILGLQKGAVTPFGILNDQERRVKVLIDAVFSDGLIGVHPNVNTATVWLKTTDLIKIIRQHGNSVELVEL